MKICYQCNKEYEHYKSNTKYCSLKCLRKFHANQKKIRIKNDPIFREKTNQNERERRKLSRDKKKHAFEEKNRYRKKHGILSNDDLKCAPKGSGTLTKHGYRQITNKQHPNSNRNGRLFEHVFIMSEHLKRPLMKGERVHHKNGIRHDNRIENLELWHTGQPYGQRVEDKIKFYKEFLQLYGYRVIGKFKD
jgi:hypothetical protein